MAILLAMKNSQISNIYIYIYIYGYLAFMLKSLLNVIIAWVTIIHDKTTSKLIKSVNFSTVGLFDIRKILALTHLISHGLVVM